MKKQFIIPAAMGCLLILGGCKTATEGTSTAIAEIGTIESIVEDSGTAVHKNPYTIYPTVNGKILECRFEEGDTVKKGDVLYMLDATALEDQITQAELSLRSANQGLAQAEDACKDLTVTAKAGGIVTACNLHVGDFVTVGAPIAEVVDRENMTLTVPFDPADAAKITVGSSATITFPSFNGTVSGTAKRIYDAPTALAGGRQGIYIEFAFKNPGALAGGEAATVQVGSIACMESGQVSAATAQALYATQSGQVLTLPIAVGSSVKVGDVIMTIDSAAVTNARSNAALAKESAATSLSQLTAKREDYILRAPADGTILTRNAKIGDYAAAANPLAILAEEHSLGIEVPIDEIYIDKIFPDQAASVTFTDDAGQAQTYTAQVRKIDEAGVVNGGVTDYTVELSLEDTTGLKAGMNVSVSITTEKKENCLRIPLAALRAEHTVQVQRDGKTEEVSVTTGITGGGFIEITEGLNEGDTVVIP